MVNDQSSAFTGFKDCVKFSQSKNMAVLRIIIYLYLDYSPLFCFVELYCPSHYGDIFVKWIHLNNYTQLLFG